MNNLFKYLPVSAFLTFTSALNCYGLVFSAYKDVGTNSFLSELNIGN